MLHRFLPLADLMYVSVSLPAHVEADTTAEFSFDHVPEGVYSVEVEEQGYLKSVQADVRVHQDERTPGKAARTEPRIEVPTPLRTTQTSE